MPLSSRGENVHLLFIAVLIISQVCFGSITPVAAVDEEHSWVMFQDDFEDGIADDWNIVIPPDAPLGSAWAVELDDDNHVFSLKERVEVSVPRASAWTNYTLELRVKLILSRAHAGIIWFRAGRDGGYSLAFGQEGLHFYKWVPASSGIDISVTEEDLSLDTWYTFKIVCVGNSIGIYVDDAAMFSYIDEESPLLSDGFGFEGLHESHVYFDDIKVSTTHRLFVTDLIMVAKDEINKARMIGADTVPAEGKLTEAQDAFDNGDLLGAELLAKEAIRLARHAPVGHVSVDELLEYAAEYDTHTVEILGTIRDIRYEHGVYSFAVDDGTAVISATFSGTLEAVKIEDEVKVVGTFDASTATVTAERLEKMWSPSEELSTFLVFKDDFEDGDFADWRVYVSPEVEGSALKVEKENGNHVLSFAGRSEAWAGEPEWTDYILEFKIKLIKGLIQISFRATDRHEYTERYSIHLSNAHMDLAKETSVPGRDVLRGVDLNLNPDAWYHLKIICLESVILVLFNDHLKLEYTDEESPFLSGTIGLDSLTYDYDDKSSHILFDDVKVSKIATTSVVNDLIAYAQSEIDKAKEINADVSEAELRLEQAKQALDQEDYQMVKYFVDEAVWLAKRASLGKISLTNLKAMATKCSGHVVTLTGTVKNLEARHGVGYDFYLDDGASRISVTYQGELVDIGNDYTVTLTGIFDARKEHVTASEIEKITGAPASPFGGVVWNLELVTLFVTICGATAGASAWVVRTRGRRKRRKILFQKLMDEVDDVYSRFKLNARRCEAELYKLKDQVLDEFKEDVIDEEKYSILNGRIDGYLKEVKEEITGKSAS